MAEDNQWWGNEEADAPEPTKPNATRPDVRAAATARMNPATEVLGTRAEPELHPLRRTIVVSKSSTPRPVLAMLGSTALVSGGSAGLVGGVAATGVFFVVGDVLLKSEGDDRLGLLAMVVPAIVAVFIAAWPSFTAGAYGAAAQVGGLSGAVASGFGIVALGVVSPIYHEIKPGPGSEEIPILALGFAFAVVAGAVGAAIGLLQSSRKAWLGVVGGTIGGLNGGALLALLGGGPDATASELILVIPAVSTFLGLSLGAVERLGKQVWLEIVEGPLAGREVILYGRESVIGSSAASDIVLADSGVSSSHLCIETGDHGVTISPMATDGAISVNHMRSRGTRHLKPDDLVAIGNTYFYVRQRAAQVGR